MAEKVPYIAIQANQFQFAQTAKLKIVQHNSNCSKKSTLENVTIRWIKAQDIDQAFEKAWLHLYDSHPGASFIHHPDWLLAANTHLLAGKLRLGLVSDANDQPIILLPLGSESGAKWTNLPRHDHFSLCDALIHHKLPEDTVTSVLTTALDADSPRWASFNGMDVPDTSVLVGACRNNTSQWLHRPGRQSAWFDCTAAPAVPGKLRRNLTRLRKQLVAKETLATHLWIEGDDLPEAFEHFLYLEKNGWKGQGESTAIADSTSLKGFYQQLLTPRHTSFQTTINLLMADNKPVAAQFGVRHKDTLSLLKVAYDEQYAHYSPGSLLLHDVMNSLGELPINTLSLVTSPVWAERWHPQMMASWHVSFYKQNLMGRGSQLVTQARTSIARQIRATSLRK